MMEDYHCFPLKQHSLNFNFNRQIAGQMKSYINKLENENKAKDEAIEKASHIIKTLTQKLERTQFHDIPDYSDNILMLADREAMQDKIARLEQQLMEIMDQYRAKERAFQNALSIIEDKENVITNLRSRLDQLNAESCQDKENAQREIEFVKRITENISRSEIKNNLFDVSAIIKRRNSPDNSFILVDSSNNSKIQRKRGTQCKFLENSIHIPEGIPTQDQTAQYVVQQVTDFDWESTIQRFVRQRKGDVDRLMERAKNEDYIESISLILEEQEQKYKELYDRHQQVLQRVEDQQELLSESLFGQKYLVQHQQSLISFILNCFQQMITVEDQSEYQINQLVSESGEFMNYSIELHEKFSVQHFHDLIFSFKRTFDEQSQALLQKQYSLQRMQQELNEMHLSVDYKESLYNSLKDYYFELQEKILGRKNVYEAQSITSHHRKCIEVLDETLLQRSHFQDLSRQYDLLSQKMVLTEAELNETDKQCRILRDQLIKEEILVRQSQDQLITLQDQLLRAKTEHKQLEESNLILRDEVCQLQTQLETQLEQYQETGLLKEQIAALQNLVDGQNKIILRHQEKMLKRKSQVDHFSSVEDPLDTEEFQIKQNDLVNNYEKFDDRSSVCNISSMSDLRFMKDQLRKKNLQEQTQPKVGRIRKRGSNFDDESQYHSVVREQYNPNTNRKASILL